MGQKIEKLRRILDRDGGRCGIHMSGCGERLSLQDAEIGHIVPKVLLKPGPYDNMVPQQQVRTFRSRLTREGNRQFPKDMNIQPMHKTCNLRMGSAFPLVPIINHCSCCEYVYIARRSGDTRPVRESDPLLSLHEWRPVLPDDAGPDDVGGNEIRLLMRRTFEPVAPVTSNSVFEVAWSFDAIAAFSNAKGQRTFPYFILWAERKDGTFHSDFVSLEDMLDHNLTKFLEVPHYLAENLTAEEEDALDQLPWGNGWRRRVVYGH